MATIETYLYIICYFQDSLVVLLTVLGHVTGLDLCLSHNIYLDGVLLQKFECLGLELSVVRDIYHVLILDYYNF